VTNIAAKISIKNIVEIRELKLFHKGTQGKEGQVQAAYSHPIH
jgi:hypothetical protein